MNVNNSSSRLSYDHRHRLNTVCPYYTMFPLEFPMDLLHGKPSSLVILDPFCGRGTTNYAARCLGFRSYGFDTSPVAVAISKAKLSTTTTENITTLANHYLAEPAQYRVPEGNFWQYAYHPKTLDEICRIRSRLLQAESSDSVHLLRAVMMGALHGPLPVNIDCAGYFSNQMPRTFAVKPRYAVNYWKNHALHQPPRIRVINVIKRRSEAVLRYTNPSMMSPAAIQRGNSANWSTFRKISDPIDLVISSPPYYGVRTYIEDQWLRYWFLGGSPRVAYGGHPQLDHGSPEKFAADLSRVWKNVALVGSSGLRMVLRFGRTGSRSVTPETILRRSLALSGLEWKINESRNCGTAADGKRQAEHMGKDSTPSQEHDYFISLIT